MAAETRTFQGVTYTNGNAPKSILAPLDGDNWGNETAHLRKDAAASYNRARAEVLAKTGIVLAVRGWNRTEAEQRTFYLERHKRWTPGYAVCCSWNDVPYRFTGTAHASPPGKSNHGWGLAVDVVDFGTVGQWNHPRRVAAIAILKRHGWTDDEGRGSIQEPWHLVYAPALDQHRNDPKVEDFLMALSDEKQDTLYKHATATVRDQGKTIQQDEAIGRTLLLTRQQDVKLVRMEGQVVALTAAVTTLAANAGLDRKAVERILTAAVDKAVSNFELTLAPKES